jgi:hypothetical protein
MPSIFGLCVANHILTTISGYPTEYSKGKNRARLYEGMIAQLAGQESRLRGKLPGVRVMLNENDVGYIVEEVFKGKSVVSGLFTRLVLTRWEPLPARGDGFWGEHDHMLTIEGVVLMTKEEAQKHEKEVLNGGKPAEMVWGPEVVQVVEARRNEESHYAQYR